MSKNIKFSKLKEIINKPFSAIWSELANNSQLPVNKLNSYFMVHRYLLNYYKCKNYLLICIDFGLCSQNRPTYPLDQLFF